MIIFSALLLAFAPANPLAAQSNPVPVESSKNVAPNDMLSSPQQVLAAYRTAIQELDGSGMKTLFSEESQIFENGKSEGSFAYYFEHHLGPELDHIKSFTFTNPKIDVTQIGDTALATETYGYVIILHDGRKIARTGVATSALERRGDSWKILRYHSSSRAPKKRK